MFHLRLQQNQISVGSGSRCLLGKQLIHHIWTLVILSEKVSLHVIFWLQKQVLWWCVAYLGTFGKVYKGKLQFDLVLSRQVAVRTLKSELIHQIAT